VSNFLTLLTPGRLDYLPALHLQEQLVELRRTHAIGDTLLLLEHPPVLTLGRNATRANLLASDTLLAQRGIALHTIKRGGDVTYHGPGQLVGYPIMDLRAQPSSYDPRPQRDQADLRAQPGDHDLPAQPIPSAASMGHMGIVDFVRLLEEALIRTAGEFGVPAQRIPGRTGVWTLPNGYPHSAVPEKKLAAVGVHVSRGITSHGFALNISTDLRDFALIIPCGIADRTPTNLADEAPESSHSPLTVATVQSAVARNLGRVFQKQILALDTLTDLHPSLTLATQPHPPQHLSS
jgi:lipoyl(octanoyl) transferase